MIDFIDKVYKYSMYEVKDQLEFNSYINGTIFTLSIV